MEERKTATAHEKIIVTRCYTPAFDRACRACLTLGLALVMVCFGDTLTVTHAQGLDGGTKIYKQNADSVFLLLAKSDSGDFVAQGSGFLIKGQKIVTNAHVANAGKIYLVLCAAKIPTKLDSIDTYHDLGVGCWLIFQSK